MSNLDADFAKQCVECLECVWCGNVLMTRAVTHFNNVNIWQFSYLPSSPWSHGYQPWVTATQTILQTWSLCSVKWSSGIQSAPCRGHASPHLKLQLQHSRCKTFSELSIVVGQVAMAQKRVFTGFIKQNTWLLRRKIYTYCKLMAQHLEVFYTS